jgi:hypothetical protein
LKPYDFLHPSTPRAIQAPVRALGVICEQLPLIRETAGSVLIVAHKK